VFQKLFAPCEALMRGLKLGQKFALIAVALIVPLAYVTYSYVLLVGWLSAGFFRSMTSGVRRHIGVLDAVASGDFSGSASSISPGRWPGSRRWTSCFSATS
jgi:hypothetical protein